MKKLIITFLIFGTSFVAVSASNITQSKTIFEQLSENGISVKKSMQRDASGNKLVHTELTNTSERALTFTLTIQQNEETVSTTREYTIKPNETINIEGVAELKNGQTLEDVKIQINLKN